MRRQALEIAALAVGSMLALYAVIFLLRRPLDLGLWLILLLALPLLIWGIWPRQTEIFYQSAFGHVVKVVLYIGYGLFTVSFAVTSCLIASFAADPPDPGADAVLILGAGLWGADPSLTLTRRLDTALTYAKANPAALIVVSGGQGPDEDRTEASAMAEYLEGRGIDGQRILQEDQSYSTYDNFALSKAILDERLPAGYRVVFVTSDFHIYRSSQLARAEGLNAQGLASLSLPWYIPMYYAREYLVILKYWIFGASSLPWLSRIF